MGGVFEYPEEVVYERARQARAAYERLAALEAINADLLAALEAVNKCDGAILPQDIWFTIFEAVHKATGGQRP